MPAGDLTQGYIFVPAEKNIDQTKMNAIVGQAYINPAFISAQTESTSSTTGDYFLLLKSGGTLAKIVLDNLANSLAATTGFQQQIWSTRLRSFNSVGNCNFEVDQLRAGVVSDPTGATAKVIDRWTCNRAAGTTARVSAQSVVNAGGPILLPGTNFGVSANYFRVTLTTAQAVLAAGDYLYLLQSVEGPMWRELSSDVHSISILCRSSVANLTFGLSLRDSGGTRSLTKLCTLGAANTLTLIQLPNLPVWASGGGFVSTPGSAGYLFAVTLAAGTTFTSPANDTWQNGNFLGATGQINFAAQAVNSTFDLCFIQHEPGSQCTTLLDVPFSGANGNLAACQRYLAKSYDYATKPATLTTNSMISGTVAQGQVAWRGNIRYPVTMAKVPTITLYSATTGAVNTANYEVNVFTAGTMTTGAIAVSSILAIGDSGFNGFTSSGNSGGVGQWFAHYTADTGW
jgi:hypothetical protein